VCKFDRIAAAPALVQGRIRLAPNVTLALHNVVNKNPRAATGFALDILLASPGATVRTENTTRWGGGGLASRLCMASLRCGCRAGAPLAARPVVSE
jgi:hypothetical protein